MVRRRVQLRAVLLPRGGCSWPACTAPPASAQPGPWHVRLEVPSFSFLFLFSLRDGPEESAVSRKLRTRGADGKAAETLSLKKKKTQLFNQGPL